MSEKNKSADFISHSLLEPSAPVCPAPGEADRRARLAGSCNWLAIRLVGLRLGDMEDRRVPRSAMRLLLSRFLVFLADVDES